MHDGSREHSAAGPPDYALDALTAELRDALAPGILLHDKMADGGMGTVFRARDPALKRAVVVKVLSPALAGDARARERFAREAQAAAAVAHPNVVAIHQVGLLPRTGTSYLVMQFIDGPTLAEEFPAGTVAPVGRARRIVGEIAAALAAAHARGLVHRDIKPSNVMLDRDSDRAVVLDFGISAAVGGASLPLATKLTMEGSPIGTPQYMSPEQAAGEPVTDKSDVYNLGLVAFELVTGRSMFTATTPMALMAAHINTPPPTVLSARPDLDPAFAQLIDRCVAKAPADRPSALEIEKALLPAAHALIEWPPPGLQPLHAKGWVLTTTSAWLVSGVLALFALLFVEPALATGAWAHGETSWIWRVLWAPAFTEAIWFRPIECGFRDSINEVCPPSSVDAAPIWLFAITVIGLLVATGMLDALRRCATLGALLRSGRRAGYPWPVLLAVAWDAGPATESLLNGTGSFVFVEPAGRLGLLARRRRAVRWFGGWMGGAAVLPIAWLFGVLVIGDAGALWLTPGEFLLLVSPLAVALIGWQGLLLGERRVRARGREASRRRATPHVTVPASLVAEWLKSGEAALGSPGHHGWRRAAIVVAIPLVAAASAVLAAGPIVLGANVFALVHGATMRGWSKDWLDYQSQRGVRWSALDRELALASARFGAGAHDAGRVVRRGATPDSLLRGALTPSSGIVAIERDTAWRWLGPWRAFADSVRTRRPAEFESLRQRPGGPAIVAAVLAWEAGDRATARVRTGEELTMARYWMAAEFSQWMRASAQVRPAIGLWAQVARAGRDSLELQRSRELLIRLDRYLWAHRVFLYEGISSVLMADPASQAGELHVGDSTIAPGVRRQLAEGAVAGVCFNGREMLFGRSVRRQALQDSVEVATRDLPGMSARLRAMSEDFARASGARAGLNGMVARARWCARYLRWAR